MAMASVTRAKSYITRLDTAISKLVPAVVYRRQAGNVPLYKSSSPVPAIVRRHQGNGLEQDKKLPQIEEQAQQVKDEANLERELTLILGRLDEFASRVKTGLHEADWLTRREIIRALVKRVEIDQEQVRVVFRITPPPQASQLPSEKDAQSLQHCRGRDHPSLRCPTGGL